MSLKPKPKMLKNPKMSLLIKEMTENHLQNLEIYTDILSEYKTKVKDDVKEIRNTLVAVKESLTERLNKYLDFLKDFMRESSKYFRDESEAISYRTLLKSSTAMNEILKYVEFVNEELQTLKSIKDSQSFIRLTDRTEKLQNLTTAINRINIDDYLAKKKRGPVNIPKEKIRSKNEKLVRGREKETDRGDSSQRAEREEEEDLDERVNSNTLSSTNLKTSCANLKNFNSFKNTNFEKLDNLTISKNTSGNLNNPQNLKNLNLNSNLIDLQTPEFPRVTDLKFQNSGNSNSINQSTNFDPKNFNNLSNYTNNVMNLSQSHNSSHSPPKKLLNQNFSRERENYSQNHSQERENFNLSQSRERERETFNLNLPSQGTVLHNGLNKYNHSHSVAHNRSVSQQSKDTHAFSHFNFLQNKTHRQRESNRIREREDNFYFSKEGKFTDERSLDEDLIEEDEFETKRIREPLREVRDVREVRESIMEVRDSIRDQLQHKETINLRENTSNLNFNKIRDSNRDLLKDSNRLGDPIREVMKDQPNFREKSRENSREQRDQIRDLRESTREREVLRDQVIVEKSKDNSREPREIKEQKRESREQIRDPLREKTQLTENSRGLREQIRDQIRESTREPREGIREPIRESSREKIKEIQISNPVVNQMHLSVNNINLVQREIPVQDIPEYRTPSMDSLGLEYEDSYNATPMVTNSKFNELTNFNIKDKDLLGVDKYSNSRENQLEQEAEPEEDLKPNIDTSYDPQNIESLEQKFKQFIILDKLGSFILTNIEELIHFKVVYKSDYIYNFPQNYSLEKEFLIKDQSFVNLKKNFENVQLTILKKENDNRHLSACVKLIEKYFKFFVRRKDEHGNLMFKGVLSCDFISFENYFSNAYKAFEPIETIQIEVFLFKYDLFTDYDESYDKTNLHRNEMKILIDNGKIINALRKHYS
jgi:hypothetical protein